MKNKKKIGRIVNTFGLKGMLKVSITCSDPALRFKKKNKILILNELNTEEEFEISSLIIKNSRTVYIGLTKYKDINEVLHLVNRDIYANIDLDDNTFFFDDLVGLKVIDPNNKEIGSVDNIVEMPKGEYILINKKVLLPFKLDFFIKEVDLDNKKIYLTSLGLETFNSCNEN